MKLSTKKLFSTIKNSPKRKFKINHKQKLSSPYVTSNSISKNSTLKSKLFTKTNNTKENPFSKPQICSNRIRNKNINKILSSKNQNLNLETLKTNEDSYINNLLLTSESDSNKYEQMSERKNKFLSKNEGDHDINTLCELFKQSNLKSTIVIDSKGNNNLDLEQKKIIDNYFNKKNKNKINSIPVEEYKENKVIFQQKTPLNSSNKKALSKINNNVKQIINTNENKNKIIKHRIVIHKKILSTRENINKNININDSYIIKKEEEKNEIDNNSIFENCSNKSINSSFLGSSLDDKFFQDLTENRT